ncbi:uncharacterized protein LOC122400582 [Colletes gigas]|uniref:uncharacterized protein LOC122400582 n=1 Tax=Colletes gigas TaxID=935657 RepID=UPI001C9ADED9|nr:uncharacterized protein LOC122400582 [Colletes gigas]
MPCTEDEWRKVAKEFENSWNYPHCIEACDGKHIVIQSPKNSGSMFFNYKGTFSIVLPIVILRRNTLQVHIMKPFSGYQEKSSSKRIYNYRHSLARRVVENAFGLLASVFRVFRKPLMLNVEMLR